jgi:ribosomal-protein-alanine N-acetyltransferase
MFELETERLYLVETPLHVIETRIKQEHFDADVLIGGQTRRVHFPAEWPGDAFGFFPHLADLLRRPSEKRLWSGIFILIEKTRMVAVGNMGTKGAPDATGSIDIGYGMNASGEGNGYMTEAVQSFAERLLAVSDVQRVTADCLDTNTGSRRVLEKAGFTRLGERYDAGEGGTLIFWERRR